MPLKIRTAHGKVFHRCGMRFDGNWKIVNDDKLDEPFASPGPAEKGKHPKIGEILMDDPMLLCLPVDSQGYPMRPPSSDSEPDAGGDPGSDSDAGGKGGEDPGKVPEPDSKKEAGSKIDSKKESGKGKGK